MHFSNLHCIIKIQFKTNYELILYIASELWSMPFGYNKWIPARQKPHSSVSIEFIYTSYLVI